MLMSAFRSRHVCIPSASVFTSCDDGLDVRCRCGAQEHMANQNRLVPLCSNNQTLLLPASVPFDFELGRNHVPPEYQEFVSCKQCVLHADVLGNYFVEACSAGNPTVIHGWGGSRSACYLRSHISLHPFATLAGCCSLRALIIIFYGGGWRPHLADRVHPIGEPACRCRRRRRRHQPPLPRHHHRLRSPLQPSPATVATTATATPLANHAAISRHAELPPTPPTPTPPPLAPADAATFAAALAARSRRCRHQTTTITPPPSAAPPPQSHHPSPTIAASRV